MANWDDPLEGPVRLGRYELIRRIGVGGMAEVFLARLLGPANFAKTVVIKRILPRLARDPLMVRMFVEEARIAAAADHDNIAKVYELTRTDAGEYLMVMEYIDGIDLEVLLREAAERGLTVPPWFAVHVAAQTLEALSFVHGLVDDAGRPRNVVHRDATPSNIFLSQLGQVKLSDFGVARFEGKSPTTQAGQLKGKIAYMSPEQLRARALDARADVFSVGVVLWEALTQERLFGHLNEMRAMMAICDPHRPAPSERAPHLPDRLDAICAHALALDPDARYPSAETFQSDLLDVLHDLRAPVRPRDVRAVLEQLSGRAPPSEETSGRDSTPPLERSFVIPIEDLEETPNDAIASPTLRQEVPPADLDATEADMLATLDEGQDPAVAVEVAELRALMTASMTPEVGPPTEVVDSGAVRAAMPGRPPTPSFRIRSGPEQAILHATWTEVCARGHAAAADATTLEICARGDDFLPLAEVGRLTGQDLAYDLEPPSNVTVLGQLDRVGIIPLLARLGLERATGVLAVARPDDGAWYELELFQGRPTRLISPVASTQLPALLVAKGPLGEADVARLAHHALAERRPLADLAATMGAPHFDHETFTRARLERVFDWPKGDYTFNADRARPRGHLAIAPSTLALLPALVSSTRSEDDLRSSLKDVLHRALEPEAPLLTAQALFTADQRETISSLVEAPLQQCSSWSPEARRAALALARVLIDANLAR